MKKQINQHRWEYFQNQLFESHVEQFGNKATFWQDFHQASVICSTDKNSVFNFRSTDISRFYKALVYDSFPSLELIPLPKASKIEISLSESILQRRSCRETMSLKELSLQDLGDLLYYGYGKNSNGFRNVPSGGSLYPLDLYVYCSSVKSMHKGLYYYSAQQHGLRRIPEEKQVDLSAIFCDSQTRSIVSNASAYLFITASFLKTIWKYFERGYRFSLIEAGHLAQNVNLVATGKNLACLNIGGFYDWETNQLLKIDGILDANIYVICVGYINK